MKQFKIYALYHIGDGCADTTFIINADSIDDAVLRFTATRYPVNNKKYWNNVYLVSFDIEEM